MKLIPLVTLSIILGTATVRAEEPASCQPPYDPSNIVEVVARYSEAMDYIAKASDSCRKPFAEQFMNVFRESWLVSDGCVKATLEDVEYALNRRKNPLD